MSAVVDASLPLAALTDAGPRGDWAASILRLRGLTAPHLLPAEVTNVLRRLELTGQLSRLEAGAAARDLARFDIQLHPFAPFAERIWQLRANVTSYDAWYVAIAEAFDLPLATLDGRLAHAPGPRCRFLLPPA